MHIAMATGYYALCKRPECKVWTFVVHNIAGLVGPKGQPCSCNVSLSKDKRISNFKREGGEIVTVSGEMLPKVPYMWVFSYQRRTHLNLGRMMPRLL